MLRISLQTLRARRGSLAGAFVAIFLAVMLAYGTGLLIARGATGPGPGRLAAADAVVRADPSVTVGSSDPEQVDVTPAPRLPAEAVARAAKTRGVAEAIGDVSFAVGAGDLRAEGAERLQGHGWVSASLTPYRLSSGHAPSGPRDVVVVSRLAGRLGARLHITAPGGEGTYRVAAIARGSANQDRGQAALFFTGATADTLSGTPGRVNAVGVIAKPGASLDGLGGPGLDVLDRAHAAAADAGDPQASDREAMVAIFGTMGGIAGFVALFVVAGTFALAIAQRRKETAVLRALGATPRQVRRLIATEALFVSLVASVLGLLAGRPLANALVDLPAGHGDVPAGFTPGHSWIPLVAALGMGVGIAQLAVVAAARRAGKVRPAEALREVAIEHGRPGVVRTLTGVVALGGGAAMALLFKGEQASAFSILAGILLAGGTALLGRWLLGLPAALLARPLRALGPAGLLASTGLAANRWRSAALATPIVLIAMLVGTQGVLATSSRHDTEGVTAARVTAAHVVTGRDGAPLPAGSAERLGGTGMIPTQVFLLGSGLTGWDTPWAAAGLGASERTLDLGVRDGDIDKVRGTSVAISEVVAAEGHLQVGDVVAARLEDATKASLRVAAVYERAAGLGHVVMDRALAWRHAAVPADAAVFVAGRRPAAHSATRVLTRSQYLGTVRTLGQSGAWGVWVIIGLSIAFAALSLVNTAAMVTAERRGELATIRLLGGTRLQAIRTVALELAPIVAVGLIAGASVAAIAVMGVPAGVRGIELTVSATLVAGLAAGAALLGLAAGVVTARKAIRVTPAAAMRAQE